MSTPAPTRLSVLATEVVDEALGRGHRRDPVRAGTGGPAGNARLTAWTGLLLLVLFVAELLTLLDVGGLISWHLAIGALLVPPALLKTGSTGWRLVRYYLGDADYGQAGPPVPLLRALGPLVVISTLALLGSGLLLVLIGPDPARTTLFTLPLLRVDYVTLHQAVFIAWATVTGAHLLARLVPAVKLTVPGPGRGAVPGNASRALVVLLSVALAALCAVLVVSWGHDWRTERGPHDGPRASADSQATPVSRASSAVT
ncbi:hypothetical protein ACIB24_11290 [Spongisporangium articulatum]|uniref:Cytochrome b561 bacterial/Ni-hydrogenase domain-containing protein n=1 Tax=Spongisporangium articulatum TaxID=3362603 RepID=A0ABW8ANS8_9ACTN